MRFSKIQIQVKLLVLYQSLVSIGAITFDQCRPDDALFLKSRSAIEVFNSAIDHEDGLDLVESANSPPSCFTKCKNIGSKCKSALFYEAEKKCHLKDANRFNPYSRVKEAAPNTSYFEKMECSSNASGTRQRRRVEATVKKSARDCKDLFEQGLQRDGIYFIHSDDTDDLYRPIRCRMSIFGGGWTVIQKRFDGSTNFNLNWTSYKNGIGDLASEFWYGNENIHNLTKNGDNEVLFELKAADGQYYHPYYDQFKIKSESQKYQATVGSYKHVYGQALPPYPPELSGRPNGQDFELANGQYFSTVDSDNDGTDEYNCAFFLEGGFWLNYCTKVNLNGQFGVNLGKGIRWDQITDTLDRTKSLQSTEMMVRRKN